ncbi:MAG: pilus assembly PilX N-terminal domain-containing protein [Desulfobacterales bacterium]|nr:pilus assembly PilX N-terminal domain-containing protein [Desulfobacterales bacterium]
MRLIYKNEKGMVLPLGLMFLAIIAILGTTAVVVTTTDLKIGSNYRASEQAFYAAEAGTEEARARLGDIGQTGTPDKDWRRFIGDAASATSIFGYDATDSNHYRSDSQSNLNYTVKIKHKTDAAGNVLYWGDTDGDYDYEENLTEGEPIEIISSQGTDSGANKIVTIEVRNESLFFEPPAALYVNGNLNKSGAAGAVVGKYDPNCDTVPDIVTTTNATSPYEASNWPAKTSADCDNAQVACLGSGGDALLVNDEIDIYPVDTVISQLSANATQIISSGNNQTFGSADNPNGIYYSNGDWSGNGLNGYGILVIDGNFTTGGNMFWQGIIIVSGASTFDGGGTQSIYGALIADSVTTINGQPDIYFDCDSINNLDDTFSNYAVYGWKNFQ